MMSYHYDRKINTQQRWISVIVLFLVLVFFTPVFSWIFDVFEKPLMRSWEHNQKILTGSENFFQALYGKTQIIKENNDLRSQISRLKIDNLRVEYLSGLLEEFSQNTDTTGVQALVLSRGGFGYYDTLVINRGTRDDVSIGDYVLSDTVLIGIVREVYDSSARVYLYSRAGEQTNGFLYPHDTNILAVGYGQGGFRAEVPRDVEVKEGDIFYSLEVSQNIIAIVQTIVFDPRDPFKQIFLSYPVNISELQNVQIKKKTRTPDDTG